jgi:type I restriction enzyme, S subunit
MSETLQEWEIPDAWMWSFMGDVAEVVGGGTPSTKDTESFKDGEIPWITPADLSGYTNKYISRGARNISQYGFDNSGARLLPAGTVLFSSRAPIGYVAIAANPLTTNQGFKSFVLYGGIKPDYIYYYLKRARDIAIELASGTTFLEISGEKAKVIPVPIPPVEEQQRIIDEIEKQFSRLDVAVEMLQRVERNLERLRAATLKAAVEGRLVPYEAELARAERRDYEPADVLLQRILRERRAKWETDQLAKMKEQGKTPKNDKWKARYEAPPAPDIRTLPELPEGWTWVTLEQLASFQANSITDGPFGSNLKTEHYTNVGPRVIRLQNIGDGVFNDVAAHISQEHFEKLLKHRVKPNDIVIAALGETLPRACIIR